MTNNGNMKMTNMEGRKLIEREWIVREESFRGNPSEEDLFVDCFSFLHTLTVTHSCTLHVFTLHRHELVDDPLLLSGLTDFGACPLIEASLVFKFSRCLSGLGAPRIDWPLGVYVYESCSNHRDTFEPARRLSG